MVKSPCIWKRYNLIGISRGGIRGIKTLRLKKKYEEATKALENARTELRKPENWDKDANKILDPLISAQRKASEANVNTVPDAPFKKSWHELALKRMIREASEKGYDRLSWTPGEAQAARYDLSKSVDKIAVPMVNKDGTRSVRIDAKEGTPFKLMVDKDGKVTGAGASSDQFSGKPLSDVVGKEMAEKIMKLDKSHEFSGEGLKIGGEGMKGFYDQIIPKALEKLGKEHGVKVKRGNIGSDKIPDYFDIEHTGSGWRVVDKRLNEGQGTFVGPIHRSGGAAEKWLKDQGELKQPVYYIDIPQSLRDTATQKGFPLFSKGGYMLMPVDYEPEFKK